VGAAFFLGTGASAPVPEDNDPILPAWSWPTTPEHLVVAKALRESRRAESEPGARLVQRMVAAGPRAVAAQLDVLVHARVPETKPEDPPQILSDPQRELVLAALKRAPERSVRAALKERLDQVPVDAGARLAGVHLLGALGSSKDLLRIIELAPRHPADPTSLTHESKKALTGALTSLLRQDSQTYGAMAEALRRVDPDAGRAMLSATGATRDPRSLQVFLAAGRWQPELGPQAASLAATGGPSPEATIDQDFTAWAASQLERARPLYVRSLLQAIGSVDDGANIGLLIRYLGSEDEGVRDAALWGLRKLSGLAFPADPVPWNHWSAEEALWHRRDRPQLQRDLASGDVARVATALREYAGHRTRRGELAREILPVLALPQAGLRTLACSALEQLRSPVACGGLTIAMHDSDPDVAEAAWRALRAITGLDLPRDADSVRELLRSS
jgi:hypothetical protein